MVAINLLLTVWDVDLTTVRLEYVSPSRSLLLLLDLRHIPHLLIALVSHHRTGRLLILLLDTRDLLRERLHLEALRAVFVGNDIVWRRHRRRIAPSIVLDSLRLDMKTLRYIRLGAIW